MLRSDHTRNSVSRRIVSVAATTASSGGSGSEVTSAATGSSSSTGEVPFWRSTVGYAVIGLAAGLTLVALLLLGAFCMLCCFMKDTNR